MELNTFKIFGAFPGIGVEQCVRTYSGITSMHEMPYVQDPQYLENYVNRITDGNKYFISCQPAIREELGRRRVPYALIYPDIDRKDEFIEHYKCVGASGAFVDAVKANWNQMINTWATDPNAAKFELSRGFRLNITSQGRLYIEPSRL